MMKNNRPKKKEKKPVIFTLQNVTLHFILPQKRKIKMGNYTTRIFQVKYKQDSASVFLIIKYTNSP